MFIKLKTNNRVPLVNKNGEIDSKYHMANLNEEFTNSDTVGACMVNWPYEYDSAGNEFKKCGDLVNRNYKFVDPYRPFEPDPWTIPYVERPYVNRPFEPDPWTIPYVERKPETDFEEIYRKMIQNSKDDYSYEQYNDNNNVYISLEVPGMNKDNIKITFLNKNVTVSWEKKSETKTNKTSTISYGKFSKSFYISDKIIENKISASYENGVLKITLPIDKKEQEKLKEKVIKIS
jgi:HSP20 family molecular chaperone IbpA